jgi:putative heme-binding domain-containing protein
MLLAQHGYTPADAEEGEQLFIENCAICHGPEGDAVPRVNLARGKFRHASSDEDLGQIIKNGIPGTAMPPGNFHEHQITALIAYLRSMSASPSDNAITLGDAARGKAIFDGKGECLNCHRVNGKGSYVGPELRDIGAIRRAAKLQRSLIDPDAEILPQNRFYRVLTQDGKTITGRLLNLDTFTVQMMDSNQQLRSFLKSNLKEFGFIDKSPMPSYQGKLSSAELADVLAYLVTLKGTERK